MFDSLLTFYIKISLKLIYTLIDFIINPIISFIVRIVPDFTFILSSVNSFFARIITGITFAKEVFLNCTGYPRTLFYLVVSFFFVRLFAMTFIRAFKFLFNVYYVLRGSHYIK